MTKSRPSATKLRLSRLARCLVALGCLKLAIMGAAIFDLPMPAWQGANVATPETEAQPSATPVTEMIEPVAEAPAMAPAISEPLPQGAEAAELAAAAKPRRQNSGAQASLPAPLVTAGPAGAIVPQANAFVAPLLPEPKPLGAPLARAGVILPQPTNTPPANREESIWDALNLKSLPIPGLGSVQAAHAAALDMPVPPAPAGRSPFTPAEQLDPLNSRPTVLPGAPALPANIPHGQTADGSPLPPRQGLPTGSPANVPVPPNPANVASAPAPNIPPAASSLDVNTKAQELARQEQDILMLRQQMDQRLKDIQQAEDKMKDMLREAKDVEDKKVRSLVQMYANMKPRMAAQALENMDERIAVRILSGMAPKQSGEILTYTNPAKTAKFTEMITRLRMLN